MTTVHIFCKHALQKKQPKPCNPGFLFGLNTSLITLSSLAKAPFKRLEWSVQNSVDAVTVATPQKSASV